MLHGRWCQLRRETGETNIQQIRNIAFYKKLIDAASVWSWGASADKRAG